MTAYSKLYAEAAQELRTLRQQAAGLDRLRVEWLLYLEETNQVPSFIRWIASKHGVDLDCLRQIPPYPPKMTEEDLYIGHPQEGER